MSGLARGLPLVLALGLGLGGCGGPDDRGSGGHTAIACATPEDSVALADVTITARDAGIPLGDGRTFLAWTYDGDVPGPVLQIPLGETRRVKLVNASPRTASLHFHGVRYAAVDDGSPEHPESMVEPGCAHVYTLTADQPGVWPFHSHRDPREEMAHGLYGAVVVPFPDEPPPDHEYVVFLGQLGIEEGAEDEEEDEGGASPFAMTINGRPNGRALVIERDGDRYAVMPGPHAHARIGDRVRWRVLNVSPDEPHTFHVHGHTWCDRGGVPDGTGVCPGGSLPTDNVDILPAQGVSFDVLEDRPGTWMVHCHIVDHVDDGMFAMYEVTS